MGRSVRGKYVADGNRAAEGRRLWSGQALGTVEPPPNGLDADCRVAVLLEDGPHAHEVSGEGLRGCTVAFRVLKGVSVDGQTVDAKEERVAEVASDERVEEALASGPTAQHSEAAAGAGLGVPFFHVGVVVEIGRPDA